MKLLLELRAAMTITRDLAAELVQRLQEKATEQGEDAGGLSK